MAAVDIEGAITAIVVAVKMFQKNACALCTGCNNLSRVETLTVKRILRATKQMRASLKLESVFVNHGLVWGKEDIQR
jgi:hypothetical protein